MVWLDQEGAAHVERERALRLELQARDLLLLDSGVPEAPDGGPAPAPSRAALVLLERSGAAAVLWLERDDAHQVSWLHVHVRGSEAVAKTPLPYPCEAIDPQLLAVAAASVLDQALSEPVAPTPVPVPPTPEQVAVAAPQPAPATTPVPTVFAVPRLKSVVPLSEPNVFVQIGITLPFVGVRAGMEASSEPDPETVFTEQPGSALGGANTLSFFNDTQPYVPDADSYDDLSALGGECTADGVVTRPGEQPSKFCARVDEPGFVLVPALRLALGLWVRPSLAVALVYRYHFTIRPERFLGNQSLGVEGQLLLAGDRAKGVGLAAVAELFVGQQETPVTGDDGFASVNALSGPLGISAGLALRHAFRPGLTLTMGPNLSARLPASQLGFELVTAMECGL